MKNFSKILISVFLAVAFALFLGLAIECALNLLSFSFSASPDSSAGASYPRYELFCRVAVAVALVSMAAIVFLNVKLTEKLNFTANVWRLQLVIAIVLSLPTVKLWELVIDFLRVTL